MFGVNTATIRPKMKKGFRKYTHEYFSINATPGLLLLFPSYLQHSVPLNKSNLIRCSLAFNSVPVVGFGEEESLTELKF
jgi:K+-transporting ATPase A subunit